jgi:hypothetical protein
MTKIISFSLWGNDPKYCQGAIKNADLAAEIYPDWTCRFYCGASVHSNIISNLLDRDNTDILCHGQDGDWTGMFWRFEPASENDVEAMISRDCDSRLSYREKAAVDEWIESDKGFHIMRDHPWHGSKILGGMWGVKRGVLSDMRNLMSNWDQQNRWQTDQDFLNEVIYPRIVNDSMVHAQFFAMEEHAIPFPGFRDGLEFVGQVFDENDITVSEHQHVLFKALKMQGEPVRQLPDYLR